MSHIQRILPLPRTHGAPCPRLLARSVALRLEAAEVAHALGLTPVHERAMAERLLRQHEALMLLSIAAQEIAHGNRVLGRHYARSAKRAEAGA